MGKVINPKVEASEVHEVAIEPQSERGKAAEARELNPSEKWVLAMWQKAEEEHARSAIRLAGLRRNDAPDSPDVPRIGLVEELIASGFDVTITCRENEFRIAIGDPFREPIDSEELSDEANKSPAMTSNVADIRRRKAPLGPSPFHRDAGLFSYTAGVLGAVAFTTLAIGPGWLGFVVAFLPASAFAAWAVSGYA